jgi:hypothetical protein
MYAGVPSTSSSRVSCAAICVDVDGRGVAIRSDDDEDDVSSGKTPSFARPQSMTTVSPNAPTRTFCGLRSRWITPWLCAYATASLTASKCGKSASRPRRPSAAPSSSESGRPLTSFIA